MLEQRIRQLEITITLMWILLVLMGVAVIIFKVKLDYLTVKLNDECTMTVGEQIAYDRALMGLNQSVNIYISGDDDLVEVETEENADEWVSLGVFDLTAYCPCTQCCGPNATGITASGTVATAGRTIAADTDILPMGSHVMINGHEYIVEDVGGAVNGKHIDIFYATHEEALNMGCRSAEVYLRKE